MIIGISGLSGSGKSEVSNVLQKHGFVSVAFADVIKRVAMEVFGFTEDQLWGELKNVSDERYPVGVQDEQRFLTPRYVLQTLGSWGRDCYQEIWIQRTIQIVKELLNDPYARYSCTEGVIANGRGDRARGVVISDVRLKNEVAALRKEGARLVRVVRRGYNSPKWDSPCETEQLMIPDTEFDHIIDNSGPLVNLEDSVRFLASQ